MAVSMGQLGADFYGRSTSASISMDELYAKTALIGRNAGVPRYSKKSDGTAIPSSGAISLLDFDNAKYDAGAVIITASATVSGITSGTRYASVGTNDGYMSYTSSSYWRRFTTPDGDGINVAAYYSGGVLDAYGNTITAATFQYFRLNVLDANRFYASTNGTTTILGDIDTNGLATGTSNFHDSSRAIAIVAKNRA